MKNLRRYDTIKLRSKYLNRTLIITVCTPKALEEGVLYPLVVMHDGQNLFDDETSYIGKSWGICEHLDNKRLPDAIFVGINSTDNRTNELVPFPFRFTDFDETYGEKGVYGGQTDQYYDAIEYEVIPLINSRYPVTHDASSRAIIGSSFGGVASLYALLTRSHLFKRFGLISNALKFNKDKLFDLIKQTDLPKDVRVWMDVGDAEGSRLLSSIEYVKMNQELYELLNDRVDVFFTVYKDAIHNEHDWNKRFPDVMAYLYQDKP